MSKQQKKKVDIEVALKMRAAGKSNYEIAAHFKCDLKTVCSEFTKHKSKFPPGQVVDPGFSVSDILEWDDEYE